MDVEAEPQLGLLDELPPAVVAELKLAADELRVPVGATIFAEGEPGDALYLIRSGLVDVLAGDPGAPALIVTRGPGEVLGEQSLLTGRPRVAAAVARTPVEAWRLGQAEFLSAVVRLPELGAAVAAVLSHRLAASTRLEAGRPRSQTVLVAVELEAVPAIVPPLAMACSDLLGDECFVVCQDDGARVNVGASGQVHCAAENDLAAVAVRAAHDHAMALAVCPPDCAPRLRTGFDRVVWVDGAPPPRSGGNGSAAADISVSAPLDASAVARLARSLCARRIGVALGAGALRGFAHAGVLAVLAEERIPIDILSGASAGAIAGALFVTGHPPEEFADLGQAFVETLRTGWPARNHHHDALLSGRRLLTYLRRQLGSETLIDDLPIPFVIAATDVAGRETMYLDSGPLPESVAASAAVPGVFPAVALQGRRLVDGGTSDPVPVGTLRERGADITIAVDIMGIDSGPLPRPARSRPTLGQRLGDRVASFAVLENLFAGLDIVSRQLAADACRQADVVVRPVADPAPRGPVPARAYMAAGAAAMRQALPQIQSLLHRPTTAGASAR